MARHSLKIFLRYVGLRLSGEHTVHDLTAAMNFSKDVRKKDRYYVRTLCEINFLTLRSISRQRRNAPRYGSLERSKLEIPSQKFARPSILWRLVARRVATVQRR